MTDPGYLEEQKAQAEWECGNPYRHQSCMIDLGELISRSVETTKRFFVRKKKRPTPPSKSSLKRQPVGVICNRCNTCRLSWMNISTDPKAPEWVLVDKNLDAHVCP